MNRDIDLSTQQGLFEFLCEQSLTKLRSCLAKIKIESSITGRTDDPDQNVGPLRESLQRLFDQFRLSQRQLAAASPQNYALHDRGHSIAAGAIAVSAIRLSQISKSWTCFSIKLSQASASFFRVSRVRAAIAWRESKS